MFLFKNVSTNTVVVSKVCRRIQATNSPPKIKHCTRLHLRVWNCPKMFKNLLPFTFWLQFASFVYGCLKPQYIFYQFAGCLRLTCIQINNHLPNCLVWSLHVGSINSFRSDRNPASICTIPWARGSERPNANVKLVLYFGISLSAIWGAINWKSFPTIFFQIRQG